MTKSFLLATSGLALVFASALVFSASSTFTDQGLELRMDSDNNGAIDNSPWERELAKSPYAFGKFIPYSETDSEFIEFQVVVPKAKSANEKRSLKFTFESNEVSLWVAAPDGKKTRLFMPDLKASGLTVIPHVNDRDKNAAPIQDSNWETDESTYQDNSWWGLGQKILEGVAQNLGEDNILGDILNRNIDEVPQEESGPEIVETFKPQTYLYQKLTSSQTILKFYLKAEVKPRPADWESSKTMKRPTRTLSVDLICDSKSIAADSAKYMVIGTDSIYTAIHHLPVLSEAFAARAVYYPGFNASKYGLELLDLNKNGYPMEDFICDNSGFHVQFYRDWVHDKYYAAFKGTDIQLSDFQNDVLLCMGKPSPYLWNALKLGGVLRSKLRPENKEKFVLVGHSLGGALASGACIASELQTVTFNSLGLSYQTLINTIERYGANDPDLNSYKQQVEKCFYASQNPASPNDRKFINESVPLYTFNTPSDILTLFEHCNQKTKLETRNGSVLSIPLALGTKIELNNTGHAVHNDNIESLRNVVRAFYYIVEQCDANNQDSISTRIQKGFNIFGSDILSGPVSMFDMRDQINLAIQNHNMDAVIEEVLMQSGMKEAIGNWQ